MFITLYIYIESYVLVFSTFNYSLDKHYMITIPICKPLLDKDYMVPFLLAADGCFRYGAPYCLARDWDQDGGQTNKGILKGKNTKRSGNWVKGSSLPFLLYVFNLH